MFNRDDNRSAAAGQQEEYTGEWECSQCHAKTPHTLRFTPIADRPVYCKTCYRAKKEEMNR